MNILTDILSLIKRGVYAEKAGVNDVLVLGVNEEPEMTGVASPIPYKSVKLIKVKDFKVAASNCEYKNSPTVPASGTGQVYQKTDIDATTQACTVFFRSLKSMSSNLTLATSSDDNYIEITTEGEPNLAANVGSGAEVWKNKVGETLNFRSIVQGSNISVAQSTNEISLSVPAGGGLSLTTTGTSGAATLSSGVLNIPNYATGGGGGMTSFNVYDENPGGAGPGFTVNDSDNVLFWGRNGVGTITGVPLGSTANPKSVAIALDHYYKAYVCKISQSLTNDPTETIVYNDTGLTLTWSRVGVGQYRATWSTPISAGDDFIINPMPVFKNAPTSINVIGVSNSSFTVVTNKLDSNLAPEEDSVLQDTPIEIRIYQ
tara:strand:+ start:6694 stop:7812 length:1119 start_codon:yes stop_codon:yes gene_type:complete